MMRRLLPLVAVGLLASTASCGGSDQEVVPTTTVAPTTTATTTEEQPGSTPGPFPAGEPVDLFYLSDSAGISVAERYAALAARPWTVRSGFTTTSRAARSSTGS
jgi:hypothetical protein